MKDTYVALFLTSLIQSGMSYPSKKFALCTIKWYHKVAALTDPTNSKFLKRFWMQYKEYLANLKSKGTSNIKEFERNFFPHKWL